MGLPSVMTEIVGQLASVHLGNERTIWIHPPRDPSKATHLLLLVDGEHRSRE
jgi:hypothetical protein